MTGLLSKFTPRFIYIAALVLGGLDKTLMKQTRLRRLQQSQYKEKPGERETGTHDR